MRPNVIAQNAYGWGGRNRTFAWRNQNPLLLEIFGTTITLWTGRVLPTMDGRPNRVLL